MNLFEIIARRHQLSGDVDEWIIRTDDSQNDQINTLMRAETGFLRFNLDLADLNTPGEIPLKAIRQERVEFRAEDIDTSPLSTYSFDLLDEIEMRVAMYRSEFSNTGLLGNTDSNVGTIAYSNFDRITLVSDQGVERHGFRPSGIVDAGLFTLKFTRLANGDVEYRRDGVLQETYVFPATDTFTFNSIAKRGTLYSPVKFDWLKIDNRQNGGRLITFNFNKISGETITSE